MNQPSPQDPANPTFVPSGAALNAPWRIEYLEQIDAAEKHSQTKSLAAGSSGSFLLDYWNTPADDDKNRIIVRSSKGLILLNAFPYTSGHLLVALGDARPTLLDYDSSQRQDLWNLVDLAMHLLQSTLTPQGVNLGLNQGRAAGAGVPSHLHVHLVPRWGGDVNFMSVVAQIRVIPASLEKMAARYRATWDQMGRFSGWLSKTGLQL